MGQDFVWLVLNPFLLPVFGVVTALVAYLVRESRSRGEWCRDEAREVPGDAHLAYRDDAQRAVYRTAGADPRAPLAVRWTAFWSFVSLGNLAGAYLFLAVGLPYFAMCACGGSLWLFSIIIAMVIAVPCLRLASWNRRLLDARPSVSSGAGPSLALLAAPPSFLLGMLLCTEPGPLMLLAPVSFVLALSPIPAILGRRTAVACVHGLWRERGYDPVSTPDEEMPMRATLRQR